MIYDSIAAAEAETTGLAPTFLNVAGFIWKMATGTPAHSVTLTHRQAIYEPYGNELDPRQAEVPEGGAEAYTGLSNVLTASTILNMTFNGHDRLYGSATPIILPVNYPFKGLSLIDLDPNSTASRQFVTVQGTGDPDEWTDLDIKIDRNGDGGHGDFNGNHALLIDGVSICRGSVEAFGNNAGSLVRIKGCRDGRIDFNVHDFYFDQTVFNATNDNIQAVDLQNCSNMRGFAYLQRGGWMDRTQAYRYSWSRGLVVGGCRDISYDGEICEVDQGFDSSGSGIENNCHFNGLIRDCETTAAKFSNSSPRTIISGYRIRNIGSHPIIISATDNGQPGLTEEILVQNNDIQIIGNRRWEDGEVCGVFIEEGANTIFPRSIEVKNNLIGCATGKHGVFVANAEWLEFNSGSVVSLDPCQQVEIFDSTDTSLGIYFLVPAGLYNPTKFKICANWNDAIDLYKGRTHVSDGAGNMVAVNAVDHTQIGLDVGSYMQLVVSHDYQAISKIVPANQDPQHPIIFGKNYGTVGRKGASINMEVEKRRSSYNTSLDSGGDYYLKGGDAGATFLKTDGPLSTIQLQGDFWKGANFKVINASSSAVRINNVSDSLMLLDGALQSGAVAIAPYSQAEFERIKRTESGGTVTATWAAWGDHVSAI